MLIRNPPKTLLPLAARTAAIKVLLTKMKCYLSAHFMRIYSLRRELRRRAVTFPFCSLLSAHFWTPFTSRGAPSCLMGAKDLSPPPASLSYSGRRSVMLKICSCLAFDATLKKSNKEKMNLLLYDCVASLAASIIISSTISSISAAERKGEDEGGYF